MQITWFGHPWIRIDTAKSSILIDPFLTGNPTFEDLGLTVRSVAKGVTHVALTHGHEDHTGDAVAICKEVGAPLLAVYELTVHMASLGVETIEPGNTGGTLYHEGFDLTFVLAWHSSGIFHDGRSIHLGACCRLVITVREGNLPYGRHGDLLGYGPDQRDLSPADRHRAHRGPLHHGGEDGGARLQALLPVRDHRSLPLRDVSPA